MTCSNKLTLSICILLFCLGQSIFLYTESTIENNETAMALTEELDQEDQLTDSFIEQNEDQNEEEEIITSRTIKNIIIQGNKQVPQEAILSGIPYHIGDEFDPYLTNRLLRNLYKMGYFR